MSIPKFVGFVDEAPPQVAPQPTPVEQQIEAVKASQAEGGLWLIFDTETTGLVNPATSDLAQQPYVIEFAGVHMDASGEIVKEISVLFKPGLVKLPELITKLTGITDDMLKDASPFSCETVQAFIDAPGVTTAVAHNFPFDEAMIGFEFARAGQPLKWPKRKVCTIEASMALKGRRLKLDALHREFFGEGIVGAHRAMNDVKGLARCVHQMRLRGML